MKRKTSNNPVGLVLTETIEQTRALSKQAHSLGLEVLAIVLDMAQLEAESALVLKQSNY